MAMIARWIIGIALIALGAVIFRANHDRLELEEASMSWPSVELVFTFWALIWNAS